MGQWERDERLARAFLDLADTLQEGFYLVDFLHVLTDHMQPINSKSCRSSSARARAGTVAGSTSGSAGWT
ncbi:hypothetical protein ACN2WE_00515 [Streptomyces sp. cg28]|uniref:hypothetical protein n=1 Tax=Streptomyces sp. cg28 TaxID=3403457 RepID=UPI003B215D54